MVQLILYIFDGILYDCITSIFHSPDEQTFISTKLDAYQNGGQREIWIGGSDIGHDDNLLWWDKTAIQTAYWNDNMPNLAKG